MFDVAKAREFYVGFMGFRVEWEHRFEAAAAGADRDRDQERSPLRRRL